MEINEGHFLGWKDNPKPVRKIAFRPTKESSTRLLALLNGSLDCTDTNLPADQVAQINESKIAYVQKDVVMRTFVIRMNNTKPPFDNLNARLCFAHAFNYMGFITDILGGYATRDPYPMPEDLWGIPKDAKGYDYDLKKAKEYMAKAVAEGAPMKRPIELHVQSENEQSVQGAQLFQSDLAQIGINLKVVGSIWSTLTTAAAKPDTTPDMWVHWVSTYFVDPENWVGQMYDSQFHGTWKASAYYKNPEGRRAAAQGPRAGEAGGAGAALPGSDPQDHGQFARHLDLQLHAAARASTSGSRAAASAPSARARRCAGSPSTADMLRFVLRRCALVVPSLLGLLVVTFLLIHAVPSDPAVAMAGDAATPRADRAPAQAIRPRPADLGAVRRLCRQGRAPRPRRERFLAPAGDARHRPAPAGDAGAHLLRRWRSRSFLGVPLGVVSALNHNAWPDYLLRVFSVMGIALAAFWFAIMLQLLFSMQLGWLPLRGDLTSTLPRPERVTGFLTIDCLIAGRWDAFADALRHLALPALTLSLGGLATIVRFTRAGMLDTLQQDFVFYERAMGYRWLRLVWIFVLRNSITATVTQIGLLFGGLIAGGVVVEAIFDWPGIGSYTVQAILTGDRQVMLAVTLLVGTVYAAVNILVDVVHGLLDPRLMEQR